MPPELKQVHLEGKRTEFWKLPLSQLSTKEWEQLCDSCGQCCLVKIQDDQTDEIFPTNLACEFLDHNCATCKVYDERQEKKSNCFVIDRENKEHFKWLPQTCAYRLRHENKPLFDWHPLISGNPKSVQNAGISVLGRIICETEIPEEDHVYYANFDING